MRNKSFQKLQDKPHWNSIFSSHFAEGGGGFLAKKPHSNEYGGLSVFDGESISGNPTMFFRAQKADRILYVSANINAVEPNNNDHGQAGIILRISPIGASRSFQKIFPSV